MHVKAMQIETSGWSGDGEFTQALVDALQRLDGVAAIRVEDAPASRSDAGFAFLSNEIYVTFATAERTLRHRWLGIVPRRTTSNEPARSLAALHAALAADDGIGAADYEDEGMLQYLRTERVVPPYQTRGVKIVELVRIYQAGTPARR